MEKYIIDLKSKNEDDTAQYKAKNDIADILVDHGYVLIPYVFYSNKIEKMFSVLRLKHKISSLKSAILVYQFPLGSKKVDKIVIRKLKNKKSIVKIAIVHDVESLRNFRSSKEFISSEMAQLNSFDGLIVHNEKMCEWLLKHGINVPMEKIEVFDYLARDFKVQNDKIFEKKENEIVFAGNLNKATFLQKLTIKTKMTVYGPNPSAKYPENINYMGSFSPDELVTKLQNGTYGLIWDGDSIEECDGPFGEYEKYNSPHKLSLYLSLGLPVIVWGKSAVASIVKKEHIGLTINSLSDLDHCLFKPDSDEYRQLQNNAENFGKRLRSGNFTSIAISKLIKDLNVKKINIVNE